MKSLAQSIDSGILEWDCSADMSGHQTRLGAGEHRAAMQGRRRIREALDCFTRTRIWTALSLMSMTVVVGAGFAACPSRLVLDSAFLLSLAVYMLDSYSPRCLFAVPADLRHTRGAFVLF
jgi:hypothetical protein